MNKKLEETIQLRVDRFYNKSRQVEPYYFLIHEDCIGCGICEKVCPKDAVFEQEGVPPYQIDCIEKCRPWINEWCHWECILECPTLCIFLDECEIA